MTLWNYTISSIGWSLVGLLIGMFLGSAITVTNAAAWVVDDKGEPVSEPTTTKPRRRRPTAVQLLGVVTVLFGGLTLGQGYMQGERAERLADCQTAYGNGFSDAIDARAAAAADSQQALDELITALADAAAASSAEGRAQVAVALRTYLDRREDTKATQRENPYPDPPRDLCKDS